MAQAIRERQVKVPTPKAVRMLPCNGFGRVTTCRSSPFGSTKRIMRRRSSSSKCLACREDLVTEIQVGELGSGEVDRRHGLDHRGEQADLRLPRPRRAGSDELRWPEGTRAIARREEPHACAQLSFTDVDGHRFQVCLTDLKDPDIAYLEALYRVSVEPSAASATGRTPGWASSPRSPSPSTRAGSS